MDNIQEITDLSRLPRNEEIIKHVFFIKSKNTYFSKLSDGFHITVRLIFDVWKKTSIPLLKYQAVHNMLNKLVNKYKFDKKREKKSGAVSVDWSYLFDVFLISKCKCSKKETAFEMICNCSDDEKIPPKSLAFFFDQIGQRTLTIDILEIHGDLIENEREAVEHPAQATSDEFSNNCHVIDEIVASKIQDSGDSDDYESSTDGTDDPEYFPPPEITGPRNVSLPESSRHLDLTGFLLAVGDNTSDQQVAWLFSKACETVGIISDRYKEYVLTPAQVLRERNKLAKKIDQYWDANTDKRLSAFYCDGKKCRNLNLEQRADRLVATRNKLLENIALVQEPGGVFMGFTSTSSNATEEVFPALLNFMKNKDFILDDLFAIGTDGAPSNTGTGDKGGIIKQFEQYLNRPLHWIVCLLHLLELIIKGVFEDIDGVTKGPNKFSGPIGTRLENCHEKPIINFKTMELKNMPPNMAYNKWRNDELYLLDIATVVSTGKWEPRMEEHNPGATSSIRWNTAASRIARYYVSEPDPSKNLIDIMHFIMEVYIPMWFWVKTQPSWINGAQHIQRILQFSRNLSSRCFQIIVKKVRNNPYFAHVEMVLLAMISDTDTKHRQIAFDRIIQSRSDSDLITNPRVYEKASLHINEKADHYTTLIDWDNQRIHEPPFTMKFTTDELREWRESDEILYIPPLPCHTQAVEFYVQQVNKAVNKVSTVEKQEAHVKKRIIGRRLFHPYFTKRDYTCSNVDFLNDTNVKGKKH